METKKKVLIFVPEFPVLTQTFIQREISKLVERGILDVVVLSIKKSNGELDSILKDKIVYKKLNVWDAFVGVSKSFLSFKKTLYLLSFLGSSTAIFSRLYLIFKAYGYSDYVKKYHPDFIIAHFMSHPSSIMLIVSKILGIPLGISAHAKDITVDAEYVKQKVDNSKFILVCNKNAMEHLLRSYGKENPGNVYLKYHGLDFNKLLQVREKPEVYSEGPLILSIGRLTEKKGFRYLIEASRILKEKGIKHHTYIVGGGPLYKSLSELINELGVSDLVKIIGGNDGVPFSETVKYYNIANIFVLASIRTDSGDEDGLPNVLLEAAAFNIPIVSTDAGSIRDLIENNISGILVSQKNSQEIAKSIERLIKDEALRSTFVQHANSKAKEIFDLNSNVEEIEQFVIKSL